jgi:hypothetical protein
MVPEVDLLDVDEEPSDEQLGCLMRSVMEGVRVRACQVDRDLRAALAREAADVCQRYQLEQRTPTP